MLVFAISTSKQLTILDILSIRRLREAFGCVEYVFSHYLSVFGSYDIIPMMRSICSIGCPLHGTDALASGKRMGGDAESVCGINSYPTVITY